MTGTRPLRTCIIGCGGMARHHIRRMLQLGGVEIPVVCEPADAPYAAAVELFDEAHLKAPVNEPDFGALLNKWGDRLDAALIVTPHVYHHDQAKACLEAGLDVLLEKPMVMNADEALSLIETRDRTGRLLVVAFNGSLSPEIRKASEMLRAGELGKVLSISATVWQGWDGGTFGSWRQVPELAGGGFLFDTGAHMLNTVADLAGEDFVEIAAWLDNLGRAVDIVGVVIGRIESGALVTMHACGKTIHVCTSDVRVFGTEGILRTGVWGGFLEVQFDGEPELTPVKLPASLGAWEQFVAVRAGRMPNPSPPEVGLRMARLWDAIRVSAADGGAPVRISG
ncbi:MAG: Gfo/Idh/MocA family oxidoreductase [Anaerolineae bacterium]|nr:Gfo/Idh/MocA family oxidoreductase [Anaerolineae bacterium]